MTMQKSNIENWTAFGAVCLFTASAVSLSVPAAAATVRASAVFVAGGQFLPLSDASDACCYVERVRKNPRRAAAMDRAAKKLAARLDADTSGATFASLRLKHGLTQSSLAEKTGLKQSYLSRIENNRCTLSNETVDKLATVFGIGPLDVRAAFDRQWDFVEGLKS